MRQGRTGYRLTAVGIALLLGGCTTTKTGPDAKMKVPDEVTQASHKETPGSPLQHEGLTAAEEAYRHENFSDAESMFKDIADDTKNRPEVAERARFYEGECLRRQNKYPKAVDVYHKLLQDFPAGLYREQATGQMYLIAAEWLKPTADEIDELKKPEKERKSTRSWTDKIIPVNFDSKLPTFSAEDRALQTLERVYYADPTGIYADKSLYMLGRVHFHRENFKESARYFQQLAETYERSPLRENALMMAIIAKNNSTGGPQYDGKDMAEAMRMINSAKATSPELARKDEGKFLDQQAYMVRYQQAQKDFETAEFYRRTGHPGSAWFYYELVQRRYPGIKPFSDDAAARQKELKVDLDAQKNPTAASTTRRYWKQYVLGEEIPTMKDNADSKGLKELPESRPAPPPTPPGALPSSLPVPR